MPTTKKPAAPALTPAEQKVAERKHRLPFGSATRVAELCQVDKSFVTRVMKGKARPTEPRGWETVHRIQKALARCMKMSVEDCFTAEERGA